MGQLTCLFSEELAYLAGLFDGEGSVTIYRSNRESSLKINISSTNLDIMEYLKEFLGGYVVEHPRKGNCKVWYQWGIGSNDAADILYSLLPFLRIKKERAILGIEWQATVRNNGKRNGYSTEEEEWRDFYYLRLRELNRKGVN